MRKQDEAVPHETLWCSMPALARTVSQAVEFDQAVGVTGVAVTKLDGTARGGVLFAIAHKLKRPIRFIGVGEQADDCVTSVPGTLSMRCWMTARVVPQ